MTREAATPQREPRRYPNGQPDLDDPAWHEEDGHGGCVICLFYVPHTEDEQVRQNWPCAVVREGAGAPLREALTVLCDWIDALERRAHGEFGVWHEERMVAEARDEARAALTATPAPAALDAEALAEAIRIAPTMNSRPWRTHRQQAEDLAAAYARLTARTAATEDEKEAFFPFTHDHP